jgi:hypothetical protein
VFCSLKARQRSGEVVRPGVRNRVHAPIDRTEMCAICKAAEIYRCCQAVFIKEEYLRSLSCTIALNESRSAKLPFRPLPSNTNGSNAPAEALLSGFSPTSDSCCGAAPRDSLSLALDLDRLFWNQICNVFGRTSGPNIRASASRPAESGFLLVS